jgi:hypothetical protein
MKDRMRDRMRDRIAFEIKIKKAWLAGKTIQVIKDSNYAVDEWIDYEVGNKGFDFEFYTYRIKPEPKYRPYTMEEFDKLGELVFINKGHNSRYCVSWYNEDTITLNPIGVLVTHPWEAFLDRYTRLNGLPCGVEVTE